MAKTKNNIRIAGLIILAVIALALSIIAVTGVAPKIRLHFADGGVVSDGVLDGVDEHISDVPDGEIRYLINKKMQFEDKFSLGNVMLENPSGCKYALEFVVYTSDGTMIYKSPKINPGQCIDKDKLSAVVKSGEYDCSYVAKAYSDNEYQGEVSGTLSVSVG